VAEPVLYGARQEEPDDEQAQSRQQEQVPAAHAEADHTYVLSEVEQQDRTEHDRRDDPIHE
jgi:hypothetical protein